MYNVYVFSKFGLVLYSSLLLFLPDAFFSPDASSVVRAKKTQHALKIQEFKRSEK